MPAVLPAGLDVAAVLPREDARDALILPAGSTTSGTMHDIASALGREPRIGTSSVRRSAQLTRLFPGATFAPIRGNLDTRLRKLDSGEFDAIVLAAAGLRRLQHASRISASLPVDACIPAPGQGIIAVEIRADDRRMRDILETINDREAHIALTAERAVVTRLGGGCQMPIGAYATITGDQVSVVAIVVSPDGARAERAETEGNVSDAEAVGAAAAERLLADGAGEILEAVTRAHAPVEGIQP
jgi:hydroxymethylbilane synthase